MPNTPNATFPFDKNLFHIDLFTSGNAPDYSTLYAPGIQAARGDTEGYDIKNCPKNDPITTVEVTGFEGTDMMKFNYIGIDFGNTGDGKKWYFVTGKTIINYPEYDLNTGYQGWYTCRFELELDYWETYKDKIGNPMITLEQVTTNNPAGWNDISMLEQDILPFSGNKISASQRTYNNWKTIVGWQSKKPTNQDNYVIDGMRTTMQWNDTGDLSDYLSGLDDLANGSPAETQIWRSYITCNTYIVSEYFTTENGGRSAPEQLTLDNPPSLQVHNRLNYFPYKRAFLTTIDGQSIEFDYKKFIDNKLPVSLNVLVFHATTPRPTTTLYIAYGNVHLEDLIVFSAYPTMDFVGKNITPSTQLMNGIADAFRAKNETEIE